MNRYKRGRKEIIGNSTNSSRFQALKECMDKWLELYQKEDNDEGIDMILCRCYGRGTSHLSGPCAD